jgi:hypothetical protein
MLLPGTHAKLEPPEVFIYTILVYICHYDSMHIHIFVCVSIYIYIYINIYMYPYTYIFTYIYMGTHAKLEPPEVFKYTSLTYH